MRSSLAELGSFVADLDIRAVEPAVRDALDLVLFDTFGVTIAGAGTAELGALRRTFLDEGPARPLGTARRLPIEACAFLDATASCILELDEGNKHVRGHPMAHVLPIATALAQDPLTGGNVTVDELLSAILAGHEVAARFGRAARLRPGVHPHGNWGVTGAAAAAARLLGADAAAIAGAIDAAAGYALAGSFDSALHGTFVRNTWMGIAATSGLQAARLAVAGLTTPAGTALSTFGSILGTFDPDQLTEQLGQRFDVRLGYLKRHASCSYTHPPIDATLILREQGAIDPHLVRDIEVRTHGLAAPLDLVATPSRLAAQFSIPYLVAAALVRGVVDVKATDADTRADEHIIRLAQAVRVVHDPSLDARAPEERPARVRITLNDGTVHEVEVPNPVGDTDHHPLDRVAVRAKLTVLLGATPVATIEAVVDGLASTGDRRAADMLADLP